MYFKNFLDAPNIQLPKVFFENTIKNNGDMFRYSEVLSRNSVCKLSRQNDYCHLTSPLRIIESNSIVENKLKIIDRYIRRSFLRKKLPKLHIKNTRINMQTIEERKSSLLFCKLRTNIARNKQIRIILPSII